MKILYFYQAFKTPESPGSTRAYWFVKELIKSDCSVTVITQRSDQVNLVERETVDGIEVIFIRNSYSKYMNFLNRILSFFRYAVIATFVGLRQKNVDLTFATSTPLTVGIPVLFIKWFKNVPFVFEVRDLWPEAPIQLGFLNNPILRYTALLLEKTIYKNAKHIIALSPGMEEGVVSKGVDVSKVSMIPNMSKIDKFWPREHNTEIAKRFDIDTQKFNVIHFGSMGMANGLQYIIEAAKVLKDACNDDIHFIFVGHGASKPLLMKKSSDWNLSNVSFIEPQPMNVISELVNLCDASIISFRDIPILGTNSPNKLFDSLSAGLPIIVNSSGWTKDMIENAECGEHVSANNPETLAHLLIRWNGDMDKMNNMKKASRHLAETTYDKSILCPKFARLLTSLIQ